MRDPAFEIEQLRKACDEVGVPFSRLSPEVRARLQLLAEHTKTIEDSARIIAIACRVFRYHDLHGPGPRFSDLEKRIVIIGSLFADIGKTGPAHADDADQRLIVEMFAVEDVRDEQQSVACFLAEAFPVDAEERVRRFAALGLDPGMPMRAFWNLHAGWTLDIVRAGGVLKEAVAAAASHHLLENINPGAIVSDDGHFLADFGDNAKFDRPEKLVILLDKYDAYRRRSQGSHEHAIAWLRGRLDQNPRFRNDLQFKALLRDLDAALRRRPLAGLARASRRA